MKRFLTVFFILAAFAAGQTITVMVPVAVVPPGTAGIVQLALVTPTTATPPAALQFTMSGTTDTGILTATVGSASTAASKQISCTSPPAKTLTCIVWGLNSNTIGNGDVADVTVPISATATLASDLLTLTNVLGASAAGGSVTVAAVNGSISVFSPCDLNHDGVVDIIDINVVVSQAIAGAVACTTGDLNKDTKCNVLDVYREVLAAMPANPTIPGSGVCKIGP